jgi:hypothetical protein
MITTSPVIFCEERGDFSVDLVVRQLTERGIRPLVIETPKLSSYSMSSELASTDSVSTAEINKVLINNAETRIWWRRPTWPKEADFCDEEASISFFRMKQYSLALKSFASICYANRRNWMNHPLCEGAIDEDKLLQHTLAVQCGLTVAPLLCTNNPDHAIAFAEKHGVIALKPLGGVALKTTVNGEEVPLSMFTRRVDAGEFKHLASLVHNCPVLIQPYIEKDYELRVTVVGTECYAARIDSQASERTRTDWRNYDIPNTPHTVYELNQATRDGLLTFMSTADLNFAAIDLIVTPDGKTVFLEANPAGQYGWIEELTRLPISAAIGRWLAPD